MYYQNSVGFLNYIHRLTIILQKKKKKWDDGEFYRKNTL